MSRVTAEYLYAKSRCRDIHMLVEEHEKVIDGQMLSITENGGNTLRYELPQQVSTIGMAAADATVVFYSELLILYTSKGFKNIKLETGVKNYLILTWMNGLNDRDRQARLKLINDHIFK